MTTLPEPAHINKYPTPGHYTAEQMIAWGKAAQRKPLTESMISAGLHELEAIRQTEFVGDYELIKRLLEAALEQQQAEPKAQSDLIKRLRDTASRGVSVWGDLQMEAAREIEILIVERECYARVLAAQPQQQAEPPPEWESIKNSKSRIARRIKMKDDEIEDLYSPDWAALAIAVVITLVSIAALFFLAGYLL